MNLVEYFYYRKKVEDHDPIALKRTGSTTPPTDPTDFALRVAYVILNGGMKWSVAKDIWERLRPSLIETGQVGDAFGHPGKKVSIDAVMASRLVYFERFQNCWNDGPDQVISFCETIPHIGPVTKYHLAKNLGVDCAKPDIWLARVATASGENVHDLCNRLSSESGDQIATVDYVIWRACQQGWWILTTKI